MKLKYTKEINLDLEAIGEYHRRIPEYTTMYERSLIWSEIKAKYFNLEDEVEI